MSLFKGLGEVYTKPAYAPIAPPGQNIVGPCMVLDVMLKESDASGDVFPYKGPQDIGKIRIKPILQANRIEDDDMEDCAWPADRKMLAYPLPGEIVFVFLSYSEEVNEDGKPKKKLFYQINSTQNGSITYNSLPNVGDKRTSSKAQPTNNFTPFGLNIDVNTSRGLINSATTGAPLPSNLAGLNSLSPTVATAPVTQFLDSLLQKYNSKLKNRDSYIQATVDNNNVISPVVKERPIIQPHEGDVIHQGRYGQSIRFGSTTKKGDNIWSNEGLSGAPIMVHRVHDNIDSQNRITYTTESINEDNSSIYLCSTQKIEMRLSCSTNMYSWRTIYRIEDKSTDPSIRNTISNNEDGTLIYQKVVDMGQTLDSQLTSAATGSAASGSVASGSATPAPNTEDEDLPEGAGSFNSRAGGIEPVGP